MEEDPGKTYPAPEKKETPEDILDELDEGSV